MWTRSGSPASSPHPHSVRCSIGQCKGPPIARRSSPRLQPQSRRVGSWSWWRRGRIELPVQRTLDTNLYGCSPAINLASAPRRTWGQARPVSVIFRVFPCDTVDAAPRHYVVASIPSGRGRWPRRYLIKQRGRVDGRHLSVCHLINEGGDTSTRHPHPSAPVESCRPRKAGRVLPAVVSIAGGGRRSLCGVARAPEEAACSEALRT